MKKNNKIKIASTVVAFLMTSSFITCESPINNAKADTVITMINADEGNEITQYEVNIDDILQEENRDFNEYVVQRGDNASVISRKICRILHIPVTTKYWPVIAYLNGYPRTINQGDIIIYPSNARFLEEVFNYLQTTGWIDDYVSRNHIYRRRDVYILDEIITAGEVFDSIYGQGTSSDINLFNLYLEYIGESGQFTPSTILVTGDDYFRFTDNIPTREDLYEYAEQHDYGYNR